MRTHAVHVPCCAAAVCSAECNGPRWRSGPRQGRPLSTTPHHHPTPSSSEASAGLTSTAQHRPAQYRPAQHSTAQHCTELSCSSTHTSLLPSLHRQCFERVSERVRSSGRVRPRRMRPLSAAAAPQPSSASSSLSAFSTLPAFMPTSTPAALLSLPTFVAPHAAVHSTAPFPSPSSSFPPLPSFTPLPHRPAQGAPPKGGSAAAQQRPSSSSAVAPPTAAASAPPTAAASAAFALHPSPFGSSAAPSATAAAAALLPPIRPSRPPSPASPLPSNPQPFRLRPPLPSPSTAGPAPLSAVGRAISWSAAAADSAQCSEQPQQPHRPSTSPSSSSFPSRLASVHEAREVRLSR